MQKQSRSTWKRFLTLSFAVSMLTGWALEAGADPKGLNRKARKELIEAGQGQYIGQFEPAGPPEDVGGGWDRYVYDTEGGEGPVCITGTPLTVFHQERDEDDLLIVLDGGGACVQNAYQCSFFANEDPPGDSGIFGESFDGIENPFANWSKMFVSYCDGSVFSGDNEVADPTFEALTGSPLRYHRGLRNLTAALDLARSLHPDAERVLLSGISAGGYGVAAFAPTVYRLIFRRLAHLFVLNDSGPSLSNPFLGAVIQDQDWQFSQFYPESCTECSPLPGANQGAYIDWTLDNDRGYRGSLYSTDGDVVIRSFTFIPNQEGYRALLLEVHDPLNADYPDRYRRFIRSGTEEHTAIGDDRFYTAEANGTPLYEWVGDFVEQEGEDDDDDDDDDDDASVWVDIVEDFVPAP